LSASRPSDDSRVAKTPVGTSGREEDVRIETKTHLFWEERDKKSCGMLESAGMPERGIRESEQGLKEAPGRRQSRIILEGEKGRDRN